MSDVLKSAALFTGFAAVTGAALSLVAAGIPVLVSVGAEIAAMAAAIF